MGRRFNVPLALGIAPISGIQDVRYSGSPLDFSQVGHCAATRKRAVAREGAVVRLQLIVALIIVFLIAMFAVQNAMAVGVVFFLWRIDASLSSVIAACFGLGTLIGALITVPTMLRERILISRLHKQVEILRAENDSLNALKKDESPLPYGY